LQHSGLFTDQARHSELLSGSASLNDLEAGAKAGFGTFLARQQLADRSLGRLDPNARDQTIAFLNRADLLAAPEQLASLESQPLSKISSPLAAQLQDDFAQRLRADLASKTMEELPAETRRLIHEILDENNYFVDAEKVGWYERKTLAQLPTEQLRGLERHLGQIRMTQAGSTPFRELPSATQTAVLAFLDGEKLLVDRAARLRLTQTGALADLPQELRDKIAHHLGRQWLVQIRDQRPPTLSEDDGAPVWDFMRGQGYFVDQFKEELFSYQRLDEFDAEIRQAAERAVVERLVSAVHSQPIGELPPDLQAEARDRLHQDGHLVDQARLRLVLESPVGELPADLQKAVETALGDCLLAGLEARPIAQLPPETQAALWRYLNEMAISTKRSGHSSWIGAGRPGRWGHDRWSRI
jgi:hypothetical protein